MSVFEIERLPTPLARVAQRFEAVGPDSSADSFLLLSYLTEAAIKTIAVGLYAGLRGSSPQNAYAVAYSLVRADGLGAWEDTIGRIATHPIAGYLPPDFHQILSWLNYRRSPKAPFDIAPLLPEIEALRRLLGMDNLGERNFQSMRHLVRELVLIRNKTKAHGALGPSFYEQATPKYLPLVLGLVQSCPLFACDWLYLSIRATKGNVRGIRLRGPTSTYMRDGDADAYRPSEPGIYLIPTSTPRAYSVGDLLRTNTECGEFLYPNGGFKADHSASFLDYSTGRVTQVALHNFSMPPAPLPSSETEGLAELDIQSNVFGNLPPSPRTFVERPQIENELEARLLDGNHPIVTLHGRGGIGKTWLALHVAHKLAGAAQPPFEAIVWFSARDIDLRIGGPARVRPAVTQLADICRSYGRLFNCPTDLDAFAQVLRSPDPCSSKGRLLIFDNFETLGDPRGVHQFLDNHTHVPNKVLITSRERAFKADYPIEVRGMEFSEASKMLRMQAAELAIEAVLTDEVVTGIYETTEGHPYVMRLVLGEIAKEGRYVSPKTLIPRRLDIVQAVFERSFNKLSDAGRWVFLLVGNLKGRVPELPLLVVCGQRGIDVETGIEECERLSLIEREDLSDGQPCYRAPELARIFARKKLESDFDRLSLQEDADVIRRFGVISSKQMVGTGQPEMVDSFLAWLRTESRANQASVPKLGDLLAAVAEILPAVWSDVVDFRMTHGGDIDYALRRLVEERPFDKKAWMKRANYARTSGDDQTYIASLVSAVDADPSDIDLIREAALQLCRYIDAHKYEIPEARRGVYLGGLRAHTEACADRLDATGLSRLAWLFMLEGNGPRALHYAQKGIDKEPWNEHCGRIIERLDRQ